MKLWIPERQNSQGVGVGVIQGPAALDGLQVNSQAWEGEGHASEAAGCPGGVHWLKRSICNLKRIPSFLSLSPPSLQRIRRGEKKQKTFNVNERKGQDCVDVSEDAAHPPSPGKERLEPGRRSWSGEGSQEVRILSLGLGARGEMG